jgi:hypothetical protein
MDYPTEEEYGSNLKTKRTFFERNINETHNFKNT